MSHIDIMNLPLIDSSFPDPSNDPFYTDLSDDYRKYVHIRLQKRTERKVITIISGLDKNLNLINILNSFKKIFGCNGNLVDDSELGMIVQLQGDQRLNFSNYLIDEKIVKKELIKFHLK